MVTVSFILSVLALVLAAFVTFKLLLKDVADRIIENMPTVEEEGVEEEMDRNLHNGSNSTH